MAKDSEKKEIFNDSQMILNNLDKISEKACPKCGICPPTANIHTVIIEGKSIDIAVCDNCDKVLFIIDRANNDVFVNYKTTHHEYGDDLNEELPDNHDNLVEDTFAF